MDILFANPLITLAWLVSLITAITIHEAAHAYAANELGDPTAKALGRLTLNPLKHIDLFGTIILPIILLISTQGSLVFGWAKPVPYDPYNLQKPRRDSALIAIAGPAVNMFMAIIASLALRGTANLFASQVLITFTVINVGLAIFNLVPVHPLDGSKIILGLLPRELAMEWEVIMRRYGSIIIILLILPLYGSSPLTALVSPLISGVLRFLLP